MSLCWAGVSHRSRPVWVLRCRWWAGSVVLGLGEGCSADGCKTNPSVTGTGTAAETQDSSVRITHYTHLWIDMSFKTQINRIHPITRVSRTEQDPVNVLFIPIFLIWSIRCIYCAFMQLSIISHRSELHALRLEYWWRAASDLHKHSIW